MALRHNVSHGTWYNIHECISVMSTDNLEACDLGRAFGDVSVFLPCSAGTFENMHTTQSLSENRRTNVCFLRWRHHTRHGKLYNPNMRCRSYLDEYRLHRTRLYSRMFEHLHTLRSAHHISSHSPNHEDYASRSSARRTSTSRSSLLRIVCPPGDWSLAFVHLLAVLFLYMLARTVSESKFHTNVTTPNAIAPLPTSHP
jgi:hypothetical protein